MMDDEEEKAESKIALWKIRLQLWSFLLLVLCSAAISVFRLVAPQDAELFSAMKPVVSWLFAWGAAYGATLWFSKGHLHMKFLDDRRRELGHLTKAMEFQNSRTWLRHVLIHAILNPGCAAGAGWIYMGIRRSDDMLVASGAMIAFIAASASLKNLYLYHRDREKST